MDGFVIPSQFKPILDALFGIGAILIFGEIIAVTYHCITYRFTAVRIVELLVYGFIFAVCLDWVVGFNFFKDTVAPAVWSILNGSSGG